MGDSAQTSPEQDIDPIAMSEHRFKIYVYNDILPYYFKVRSGQW